MHHLFARVTKAVGVSLLFAVAACSTDSSSATAPAASALKAPRSPGSFGFSGPSAILQFQDSVVVVFTVDPALGANVQIGNHQIFFPPSTICDPFTNTYGRTEWMKPCTLASTPVTITAVSWIDNGGHPRIDFSPSMRFHANSEGELPTLYLRDIDASVESWSSINHCLVQVGRCENESLKDPVLTTRRDPSTGFLYRFIRHFSGYNVWA